MTKTKRSWRFYADCVYFFIHLHVVLSWDWLRFYGFSALGGVGMVLILIGADLMYLHSAVVFWIQAHSLLCSFLAGVALAWYVPTYVIYDHFYCAWLSAKLEARYMERRRQLMKTF